jgi:hypothetical protein
VTTTDPGASEVFTQGIRASPRSTAFFASRPAPSITDGFEVLVQLVIAAITTWPWSSSTVSPDSSSTLTASLVFSASATSPASASPGVAWPTRAGFPSSVS